MLYSSPSMKRVVIVLFFFAATVSAQHNRQSLLQPDYDDYNLKHWVRQMTVVQEYSDGNDINFQEVYSFDSVGKLAEYRKQGFGGESVIVYPLTVEALSRNCRYTFDYDGDVLELRRFDLKGRLLSSTHYIYAEGGDLIQTVEYAYAADSGVVTKRTVSCYDRKERLVSIDQYSADELILMAEKRKYDRHGNLIQRRQTFYEDNEEMATMEKRKYTYDAHGNWIQCCYSLDGKEIYTIKRHMVYYGE